MLIESGKRYAGWQATNSGNTTVARAQPRAVVSSGQNVSQNSGAGWMTLECGDSGVVARF